ncbi:MAG TPA: diacylglycerol kinase family protein [Gemmatimonadaceae bacterium]|nr:diacylglycerol kinase family protein [Gemmatimonadaceae bacterium]
MSIPAIVNARSGTAATFRDALAADPRFVMREVEPGEVVAAVRAAVAAGAPRVAVSGGDGSLASAAGVLAEAGVELAVLPGGTLNHFAGHLGIPTEPAAALEVAATGVARPVDLGFVAAHSFVNTSSVGSYVAFVRLRDRLERYLGYWLASLVAGLRLLLRLQRYRVEVEVEGSVRQYVTPLVFVGVGERELQQASLTPLAARGRAGLHVIVVRGRRRARLLALGLAAARRGARGVAAMPEVDSFVVDHCRVAVRHRHTHLSIDGEVLVLPTPLDYRIARGALRVVLPAEAAAEDPARAPAGADAPATVAATDATGAGRTRAPAAPPPER